MNNNIHDWLTSQRLPELQRATPADLDTIARALGTEVGLQGPGVGDPRVALIQTLWALRCKKAS